MTNYLPGNKSPTSQLTLIYDVHITITLRMDGQAGGDPRINSTVRLAFEVNTTVCEQVIVHLLTLSTNQNPALKVMNGMDFDIPNRYLNPWPGHW